MRAFVRKKSCMYNSLEQKVFTLGSQLIVQALGLGNSALLEDLVFLEN